MGVNYWPFIMVPWELAFFLKAPNTLSPIWGGQFKVLSVVPRTLAESSAEFPCILKATSGPPDWHLHVKKQGWRD